MITKQDLISSILNDRILNTYRIPFSNTNIEGSDFVCYDASGYFSPIAIRDQVIRAYLIVQRAINHKIISPERPLLVVGGGAAGLTAALVSINAGIKTVLVEKNTIKAGLAKSDRDYCPVQYDWSYEHWKNGRFPWNTIKELNPFPFELIEGEVSLSITNVITAFNSQLKKSKSLLERCEYTLFQNKFNFIDSTADDLPYLEANFEKNTKIKDIDINKIILPTRKKFGMALACTGFGDERVFIPQSNFHGIKFWAYKDHIELEENEGKVLVCGGGDGALQDFLIFSTQKTTAKEIYYKIIEGIDSEAILKAEENIKKAEDEAKRYELLLNNKKKRDKGNLCKLYRRLHKAYEKETNELYDNFPAVKNNLEKIVIPDAYKTDKLKLSYLCNHFSACYPLNHFLGLLIGKFIDEKRNEIGLDSVFKEFSSVVKITSIGEESRHVCDPEKMEDCQFVPHKVYFATECTCEEMQGKEGNVEIYRRIIIRYGILGPKTIFGLQPNFPGLQILPFTLLDLYN